MNYERIDKILHYLDTVWEYQQDPNGRDYWRYVKAVKVLEESGIEVLKIFGDCEDAALTIQRMYRNEYPIEDVESHDKGTLKSLWYLGTGQDQIIYSKTSKGEGHALLYIKELGIIIDNNFKRYPFNEEEFKEGRIKTYRQYIGCYAFSPYSVGKRLVKGFSYYNTK